MQAQQLALMQTFVCVAERQSFARAAQDLAMTPSSVSRQIKALESQLGLSLINRTTRSMSLTAAGQQFYLECRAGFDQLSRAQQRLCDSRSQPRGSLKLSLPVAFGRSHVLPHLGAFLQAFPDITLDLTMTDRYVDLVAEGMDLAIRVGHLDDSTLIAKKLLPNRRILVAAPAYLQCHPALQQPEDLNQHACLILSLNRDGEVWRLQSSTGVRSIKPRGRVRADNGEAIRQCAMDGQGVAFLSAVMVADALKSGRLQQVLPQWQGRSSGVYALGPAPGPFRPVARALMDFLATRWASSL